MRPGSLLRLAGSLQVGDLADAELLQRFRADRDGAAFAELVRRHGPMVFGACLRLLRHRQDAEDAYQACFLVLARRAGDVARPEQLAGWLHGVATRTALEARKRNRTRAREQQGTAMPEPPAPVPPEPAADLRAVLDEELARLPEKLRAAVVLCDIEGRTREAAAAQLGVPVGTLSGRLTTAHRKLAALLERRGVACAAVALAALSAARLTAAVPDGLADATADAGVSAATAGLAESGAAHPVTELARAVLAAMRATRWKAPALLLLGAAVLAPGIGFAMQVRPDPPGADAPAPRAERAATAAPVAAVAERLALAPRPRAKPSRNDPIANDLNDIFVVSELDEGVPEFFRNNRTLVAELSADTYRALAASTDLWATVKLPVNSVNDPARNPRGGKTLPLVPPSDAVRKLLDPVAARRPVFNALIRQEGTAGVFDLVGYTDRPAADFFVERVPVVRSGAVTQKDLLFAEPPAPPAGPVPALPAKPGAPAVVLASAVSAAPGRSDFRIVSDRKESVAEFFRRNRVALGCVLVSDYEKLVRAGGPWAEVPVFPLSCNDEAPAGKRATRAVRVAPPSALVDARLFRPMVRTRPDIDAMTLVLRRDEPGGVFEIVGWSASRTAYHFFEKGVRFGDTGELLQRDLLYRGAPPK